MSPTGFQLRPRGIGEMLDLTFLIYRERFVVFAFYGIAVSVTLWVFTLSATPLMNDAFDPATADMGAVFVLWGWLLILIVVNFVMTAAAAIPMISATEDTLLGRETSIGIAFRKSLPRLGWAVVTALLQLFIYLPFVACCFVPVLIPAVILALSIPAVYLERCNGTKALERSYEMMLRRGRRDVATETNWLRALVLLAGTLIIWWVLRLLGDMPQAVAQGIAIGQGNPPINTPLGPQFMPLYLLLPLQLLSAIVSGLFTPILFIVWAVFYYDIRIRHEGLDLELGARALSAESS